MLLPNASLNEKVKMGFRDKGLIVLDSRDILYFLNLQREKKEKWEHFQVLLG